MTDLTIQYETPGRFGEPRVATFELVDDENPWTGAAETTYVVLSISRYDEDGETLIDAEWTEQEETWAIAAAEEQAEEPIPASVMRRAAAQGVVL